MSTIKDVARLAGLGVATVSRALSGHGPVSTGAALRVRAAAQQLGYRPSSIARALSLQQSGAIGVYVPVFDGYFYSSILASIGAVLRSAGRYMVAANGCGEGDARQQARDGIAFLIERDCDGLIVTGNGLSAAELARLLERFPNTVLVNRRLPRHDARCFSLDHREGGQLAARALLARGHRDIAVVRGPRSAQDNEARLLGFFAELARHGVSVAPEHIADGAFSHASADRAARALLQTARHGRVGFSAVFAANDEMAMAVVARLTQSGLTVPGDVSVIGYDDANFASYASPPLTTVRVPIAAVAANACRQVLNLCYGLSLPVEREFRCAVAWRASLAQGPYSPLPLDVPSVA
jgi:LacI family transcriptional regulator